LLFLPETAMPCWDKFHALQSLHRRAGLLLLSRAVSLGATFGLFLVAARKLPVSDVGNYSLAIACSGLLITIVELGLTDVSVLATSRDSGQAGRYMIHGVAVKTAVALAGSASLLPFLYMNGLYRAIWIPVVLACAGGLLRSYGDFFDGILIGLQRTGLASILLLAQESLLFGGSTWAVLHGYGIYGMCAAYAAAPLLLLPARITFAFLLAPPPILRIQLAYCGQLVAWGFSLACTTFLDSAIFGFSNIFLIAHLLGRNEVAQYAAAYKLVAIVPISMTMITRALMADAGQLTGDANDKGNFCGSLEASFKLVFALAMPACIGLMLFAPHLVKMLYGPKYLHSALLLRFLSFTVPLTVANQMFGIVLTMLDRQWLRNRMMVGVLALHLALSCTLLQIWGAVGAILSLLFSGGVLVFFYLRFYFTGARSFDAFSSIGRPLLFCLPLAAIGLFTERLPLVAALYIPGVLCYFFLVRPLVAPQPPQGKSDNLQHS